MTGSGDRGFDVQLAGGVLTLRLTRAERLNAVTGAMLDQLADVVEQQSAQVRALVLTGAGRAFCAGADIGMADTGKERGSAPPRTSTVVAANRLVRALRDSPAPVISAVNGPAVGVGASFVLISDIVIAARSAYLLLPFTDIALLPDGGATALLAAAVGRNRAMSLSLCPERISADEAQRMGIVHLVVDDEELPRRAHELAEQLARGAGRALTATKAAINAATLPHLDAALERELTSQSRLLDQPDFAEALAAFADRRPARFGE